MTAPRVRVRADQSAVQVSRPEYSGMPAPAPAKKVLQRPATLQAAIAGAQKKYGVRVGALNGANVDVEAFTTGNIAIDHITGVGGLPRGRLVELYGPPSSGKTTTALTAAVTAQKFGYNVLFMDHEQSIDIDYCRTLGLDTEADSFLYAAPDFLEGGANVARELIGTGEVGICIFDSVAAMVPESELLAETGKRNVGDQARLMAQFCRQLTGLASRTNTLIIFLNHVQDVIDATFIGQKLAAAGVQRKTTPGGKALKFYASIRIEFKPVGGIRGKEQDELTGEERDIVVQNKILASVVKNKVAVPFKEAELRAVFGRGFSNGFNALQVVTSRKLGINAENGGVYRFVDQALAPKGMDVTTKQNWMRGELKLIEELDNNPEWLDRVAARARASLFDGPKEDATPLVESQPQAPTEEEPEEPQADELPTPAQLDDLLPS
jgi:recombination protein RecA